ncbi:DUF4837 family protein [Polaribacter sp. WD7]|uniref:DUF4837 family protein n=1 Tax=Polaribacter sp. WD7 TaxID=2269061 RepID=UPI000DF4B779|nr:DUF4837 family protein [Polaribacter sp. WD7]RCS26208.1 DUF4837 family protein [Polaribacter sp. WD7]
MKHFICIFTIALVLVSCKGNDKIVLRSSVGKLNKVMVVANINDWNGDIGKEIRNSFGELVAGLPQPEATLSVSQIAPNGFNSVMKASRNILIIGEGSKDEFFVKKDAYAKPQTVVYLKGKTKQRTVALFKKHEKEIIDIFLAADLKMIQNVFGQTKLDDTQFKTLQNLGISLTLHDKFRTVDDTGEFLWLRHHLTSGIAKTGSNNIILYSLPLENEETVADSIVAVRNRIGKKYIPGSDPETMHMITEEAYTPSTFDAIIDGKKAFETRGKWEVKNDFMAGPFINYTIIDKKNNRIIVFEGFTYAPSVNKRAFIFELEAIAKTMKIK